MRIGREKALEDTKTLTTANTATTTNIRDAAMVEDALGIMYRSPRHQKLIWMLDEIMHTKVRKAEAILAISELKDVSDLEKTYLGYMLMQRIFILKVPFGAKIIGGI